MTGVIREMMPRDVPFTVEELIDRCRAGYPEMRYDNYKIRCLLSHLKKLGEVNIVSRLRGRVAQWGASELEMPIALPTESHADTLAGVLSDGKRRLVMELVFAIQDSGKRLDYSPHQLYQILDITLRKNRKRFKQGGDRKWGLQK